MNPIVHAAATVAIVAIAHAAGMKLDTNIIVGIFVGGVFLDADKALEIVGNLKHQNKFPGVVVRDITARVRVLHSALAWPFACALCLATKSLLPMCAVISHILCDSAIPGITVNGKSYPSHSPWKWITFPFFKKSWYEIVPRGWPVRYPPQFNLIYRKMAPTISVVVIFASLYSFL